MISTAARVEDLTLSIAEEIHVRATLDATFARAARAARAAE